jgi:cation:H+ antiporter
MVSGIAISLQGASGWSSVLLFLLGVVLVIRGGDWFVVASVAIAEHLRLPQVLIGGTLVSLATTAPELTVSVTASFQGNPGLAIGNAVGSAICNIGLIVGVLCVLHPMPIEPRDFRFPSRYMLGSGILLTVLTARLHMGRLAGALLVLTAVTYLVLDYLRHRRRAGAEPAVTPPMGARRAVFFFALGAGVVVFGSRLLVDNGIYLATALGVPPMIVGLTLVALGTSLPELVTAITAARRGVPQLSLGNVLGANIMNVTLITGASATIHPLRMTRATQLYNFPTMLFLFALLLFFSRTERRLTRREGVVFLLVYAAYIVGFFVVR